MCYIKPVLAFGTEQGIIVNSHCPSPKHSQRSNQSEFDELHKECHLRKWYCLSEFENDLVGKSNQVLAKEYSGYLLVYILQDMSQSD
jgi:hypothetical protein